MLGKHLFSTQHCFHGMNLLHHFLLLFMHLCAQRIFLAQSQASGVFRMMAMKNPMNVFHNIHFHIEIYGFPLSCYAHSSFINTISQAKEKMFPFPIFFNEIAVNSFQRRLNLINARITINYYESFIHAFDRLPASLSVVSHCLCAFLSWILRMN